MRKLRVVHVIPMFETGGAEKLVIDLVNSCDRTKQDTSIICLYPRKGTPYEKIAEELALDIRYLNKRRGFDLNTIVALWRELSAIKPDVVHTHLYVLTHCFPWMLTHQNVRFIHTVHNVAEKELTDKHKVIQKIGYKLLGIIPVAISKRIQASVVQVYKLKKTHVPIILNGIDISKFERQRTEYRSDVFTFINVASFKEQKNHRLLLEAFSEVCKEIPNARLMLVGDGQLRGTIEKRVQELGIRGRVILTGVIRDVAAKLVQADAFVLSSDWEGLPISLLEAMACSLPIVTTAVGGVSDIIADNENGLVVNAGDRNALAQAMIKLAKDKVLRDRISCNNSCQGKQYDICSVAEQYYRLYIVKPG